MSNVRYLHLPSGSKLPTLGIITPFAAVIIVDAEVTSEWREDVSRWLVDSGCLYMMAWGKDCSLWDDSVDDANLEDFPDGNIPENRLVLTTWHDNESLEDVFWFAQHAAHHPKASLSEIMLIDVSKHERKSTILTAFKIASDFHMENK